VCGGGCAPHLELTDADDCWEHRYFPAAVDGKAYWCNNDGMLLARAQPVDLLNYSAWEVVVAQHSREESEPIWRRDSWDEAGELTEISIQTMRANCMF
jgi:hypothetical protein